MYSYTHYSTSVPGLHALWVSTYQANILAALQQTGIANTAGGKARAFCDIIGDQLGILDLNKAKDIAQALLP